MIKKSIVEVNEGMYKDYKSLRNLVRKRYKTELKQYGDYNKREYYINCTHESILVYHLAIFYNIGDRKFVEKCHSSPVVKVWHPLG